MMKNNNLKEEYKEVVKIKKQCLFTSIIAGSISFLVILIYIIILYLKIKPENYNFYGNHCSSGYFIPDDSQTNACEKCSIEFCDECSGTKNKNECKKCINPKTAVYKDNVITTCPMCSIGEGEKCKECNNDALNKCKSCNEGYTIKDGNCISDDS